MQIFPLPLPDVVIGLAVQEEVVVTIVAMIVATTVGLLRLLHGVILTDLRQDILLLRGSFLRRRLREEMIRIRRGMPTHRKGDLVRDMMIVHRLGGRQRMTLEGVIGETLLLADGKSMICINHYFQNVLFRYSI